MDYVEVIPFSASVFEVRYLWIGKACFPSVSTSSTETEFQSSSLNVVGFETGPRIAAAEDVKTILFN
jgi:hypothetical protein